jgi:hypothetical protein
MHLCGAINELYGAYEVEAAKPENKGKIAVVEYLGCTPMPDKKGTNYRPDFKLSKFVDRPADMDAEDGGEVAAVAAPAPKPAPAPVVATTDEF